MNGDPLGPWVPISVADVAELFRPADFRWWLTGGHALEAHLGHSWRHHADIDIGIRRADGARVHELLAGWDVHGAAAGTLNPWHGEELRAERSQNNLWCRRAADLPWVLDITIGEGTDVDWIYRRGPHRQTAVVRRCAAD